MLRSLLRFLGVWLLAAALVGLVIDGARSIAESRLVLTPLAETWSALSPTSYARAQFSIEERLAQPWLWDAITAAPLAAPTWLVLGVAGIALLVAGRRPRRPVLSDLAISE